MGVTRDGVVDARSLEDAGLEWILRCTFLARLDEGAETPRRDAALAASRWCPVRDGEVLAERGRPSPDILIVATAHVALQVPSGEGAWCTLAHVEPGMVLGLDGLLSGGAPVPGRFAWTRAVASGNGQVLAVPRVELLQATRASPSFRRFVEGRAEVGRRLMEFLPLLSRNPLLRPLGDHDTERLLLSACVERHSRGACLIEAGERPDSVFVVLSGHLQTVVDDGKGGRRVRGTARRGDLAGHKHLAAECEVAEAVVAGGPVELLRIDGVLFQDVLERNPLVLRQLLERLAVDGLTVSGAARIRRGRVVFVGAPESGLGVTTLAWALAGTLARDPGLAVTVVDLEGSRTARELGLGIAPARDRRPATLRLAPPTGWTTEVLTPASEADAGALLEALRDKPPPGRRLRVVVVCGRPEEAGGRQALKVADAVVLVRRAGEQVMRLPTLRHQAVFQAIRMRRGAAIPFSSSKRSVRIPDDGETARRFWQTGNADLLTTDMTPLGRAAGRLARLVRGRSVGVALGGGGALGFAHVGLLRALERGGIPVDVVSGVSFGSVVGAVYAAGGLEGLQRLLDEREDLNQRVLRAFFGLKPVTDFIDRLSGDLRMGDTEIPFYPVGMNMATATEFVLPDGTLGEAVQSASCMPGAWPAMVHGPLRLVDGGVVNNVPVSTLWEAGADFIVSSSIITPDPGRLHLPVPELESLLPAWARPLAARVLARGNGDGRDWDRLLRFVPLPANAVSLLRDLPRRLDDMVVGIHTLMAQNGRDRALMADYGFDFEERDVEVYDFLSGDRIAAAGLAQAADRLGEIRDAYVDDASIRF